MNVKHTDNVPSESKDNTPRILIAEDDEGLNRLIAKRLNREGFQTESCYDGKEAIKRIQKNPTSILLLDYHLPDMDGKDFINKVQKQGQMPPFIVMTGYGDEAIAVEMMKAGALDYIVKSEQVIEIIPHILRKVRDVIEQQQALIQVENENVHIKKVLRALRDINKHIIEEKNKAKLIQKICNTCVKTRGYYNASITLYNSPPNDSYITYLSTEEEITVPINKKEDFAYNDCIKDALTKHDVVIKEESKLECNTCPFAAFNIGDACMTTRLIYENTLFGTFTVAIEKQYLQYREEIDLFKEVAEDVAFALYKIELEKDQEKQEKEKINILESISDAFFNLNEDMRITYYNGAAEEQFKKTAGDVVGRLFYEAFPEMKGTIFDERIQTVLSTKEPTFFETFFHKQPYENWYEARIYPHEGGVSVYTLVTTDRKLAEEERLEALQVATESAIRLKEAQRIAKLGDFIWNVQTGAVTWSDALYELLGYDKSEKITLEKVNQDIHHPDDLEKVKKWLTDCIESQSGILTPLEYRLIHKNGSIIHVRTNGVIKTLEENQEEVFATVQDMTERFETQTQIDNYIAFLDTVIDQSPFAMWVADIDGTVQRTNQALRRLLNLKDDQVVNQYNVLNDENLRNQGVMKQVESVFKKGIPTRFTIRWDPGEAGDVDFHTARSLWIDASIFPVFGSDNTLKNVICQWVDVSDQKNAEQELVTYRNQLEKRVKERTMELEEKNRYLERMNDAMVDREFRIKELRDELERVKKSAKV